MIARARDSVSASPSASEIEAVQPRTRPAGEASRYERRTPSSRIGSGTVVSVPVPMFRAPESVLRPAATNAATTPPSPVAPSTFANRNVMVEKPYSRP